MPALQMRLYERPLRVARERQRLLFPGWLRCDDRCARQLLNRLRPLGGPDAVEDDDDLRDLVYQDYAGETEGR